MTKEIIIDGELSCNNCLEKTRCKQQQEVKEQRIGAILSYIANEDNEKYIAELKNEIPAITRCDVVLEKQLKRLEQERDEWKKKYEDAANENLKEIYELIKKNDCWRGVVNVVCSKLEQENKELKAYKDVNEDFKKAWDELNEKYKQLRSALEEIKEIAKVNAITTCWSVLNFCDECKEDCEDQSPLIKLKEIVDKINEVLND